MNGNNNLNFDLIWSTAYLIDNVYNDLMDKTTIDEHGKKINKYMYQAITKFQDIRRKSPVTFFDIVKADLSSETKKHLNEYIKDCNSESKIYQKLNGIMTEVISLIYKRAESLILSNLKFEDEVWVKKTINEICSLIKNRWRFV